ncbi:hypothetical protein B0T10DRAFT_463402 [Thelonectria olida]|uniref:Uncharacterized protein n=1 Tax=Thelonectria olida TaxID=1576542 RepID=A0A9P8VWE4_9HYPO|nr:hypothetical protein B0T10DRAFT_463402 [Thelonectria olida]
MSAHDERDDSDDSVTYIGSRPREASVSARLASATTPQTDVPPETSIASNPNKNGSSQQKPKARRGPRSSTREPILAGLKYKYILIGWSKDSNHQSVYGFLDQAGRLRRILGFTSKFIVHDDIHYRQRFMGKSRAEIRREFLQRLREKYGLHTDNGEI